MHYEAIILGCIIIGPFLPFIAMEMYEDYYVRRVGRKRLFKD